MNPWTSAPAMSRGSLTERTILAGREVLVGQRRGPLALLPFAGPAVIASIAYMDPGNFATNIQAGAKHGYELLWVVVCANCVAMLFQSLSAKVGIATGRNLAELCRERFPRSVVYAMWVASEIAAMATELAELLGASIALTLFFGTPILASMVLIGVTTYAALAMQRSGFRPIEILVGCFVGVITVSYLIELLIAPPDWAAVAAGVVAPHLNGIDSITLAVGIVGATVMPHAIYLHSSLTQHRLPVANEAERRKVLHMSNGEVLLALGLAGMVNMAMIAMAAAVFHDGVHDDIAQIDTAYRTLSPLLGGSAAGVFLLALLSSGFSSSVVGVMAGQVIMQGFVSFQIPLWLRRLAVMVPSFLVVAAGVDITRALVLSQVVLSLVLPIPMVALVFLTAKRDVMGNFANSRLANGTAIAATAFVSALNAMLLLDTAGVAIPFVSGK